MGSFNMWQKWLVCVGIFVAIFGMVLAAFPRSGVMNILFNDPGVFPIFR